MFPDDETALAFNYLVEFIDDNGDDEAAFNALMILCRRIRELSSADDYRNHRQQENEAKK